jgi:hypothetical protein
VRVHVRIQGPRSPTACSGRAPSGNRPVRRTALRG